MKVTKRSTTFKVIIGRTIQQSAELEVTVPKGQDPDQYILEAVDEFKDRLDWVTHSISTRLSLIKRGKK